MLPSRTSAGETVGRFSAGDCGPALADLAMLQAALEGRVLEAEVVWTGEGTWRPDNVCYDWDKVTNKVFVCSFAPGTALQYGEAAQGTCRAGETTSCPS